MGQTAEMIAATAARGLGLAEKLLEGVTPEMFARQPVKDGAPIITNHPAFVLGHLSIYPAKIRVLAGVDAGDLAAPTGFEELFAAGVECRDDRDGSIYPAMGEIVTCFQTGYAGALEYVGSLDDGLLAGAHHGPERYREFFPTLGIAATFLLTSHVMMHLGQFSTWRRCMGLGSAM